MFNFMDEDLKRYQENLKKVSSTAFPKAVRSMLDRQSYLGYQEFKKNIKKKFVVRNAKSNIILKSLRYEKCSSSLDVDKMESRTGQSATKYGKNTNQIRKQEFGETLTSGRKHIVKPTKYARGGSYKRIVRPENLMSKIKVKRISDLVRHPAKTEFKEFRQAIGYIKHNPDKKIFFLPSGESYFGINGIFRLEDNGKKSAKPVYSLKGKTQTLKKVPTLEPASKKIGLQGEIIFMHEAERRIFKEMSRGLKT